MGTFIVIVVIIIIIVFIQSQKKDSENKPTPSKEIYAEAETFLHFTDNINYVTLAGVRHYRTGNKLGLKLKEQVYLFPEPTNKYDKNAIKVLTDKGKQIGYIPKFHNTELLDIMNKGNFIIARISTINLDEADYPFVSLSIEKTKDKSLLNFSEKEIYELNKKSVQTKKEYEKNKRTAFELSQKGLEIEKSDIIEAVKCFEESITFPDPPPITFKRLVIYYRKNKDYTNEIRVLNKNIESVQNSRASDNLKKDEIIEIKERIKKAEELSKKK